VPTSRSTDAFAGRRRQLWRASPKGATEKRRVEKTTRLRCFKFADPLDRFHRLDANRPADSNPVALRGSRLRARASLSIIIITIEPRLL
jgi:hypothetical protein